MKDDGSTTDWGHPINAVVSEARAGFTAVAEHAMWSLDAATTRASVVELTRLHAQVAELEARVLSHADEVEAGVSTGATSTATWLAHTTKLTRPAAARKASLAKALDSHSLTREALGRGDVHVEQASVITHAVDQLPEDAGGAGAVREAPHRPG